MQLEGEGQELADDALEEVRAAMRKARGVHSVGELSKKQR